MYELKHSLIVNINNFQASKNMVDDDDDKEIIKYRDIQISPSKIENLLRSHANVVKVAVVGVPHIPEDEHSTAFKESYSRLSPYFLMSGVLLTLNSIVNYYSRLLYPTFEEEMAYKIIEKYKVNPKVYLLEFENEICQHNHLKIVNNDKGLLE
uniref:Uncharacterized protein n=1 Tax=Vespula pensylvanica TaxID=30213 RepID=A0A834KM83_VESPE|nr:hypothetical protein H0235_014193 [Vespula pensylvanica]